MKAKTYPFFHWTVVPAVLLLSILSLSAAQAQYRARFPLPVGAVPDSLGVNIHFTDPQSGELAQLAGAGFRWIRQDFFWANIETEKGKYDFSAYDRLLTALKPYNIRPIFILDYGNDLYEKGAPRSPEARAAFARFVTAAVSHFKEQGILWEMWNEPNLTQFWPPRASASEYVALALEAARALRAASPDEWFIGPGVSGMDFVFLEACFQGGLLTYWDAISFHPYRNENPESALRDYQRLRALTDRYAPAGKKLPFLNSEWGYSELYPGLSEKLQSKYLPRQALTNLAAGLRVSIWYDWHDDGTNPKETEHHFGTVSYAYKPKPTYQAAKTLTAQLNGFQFNKRLALTSPQDFCLLFTKGAETRLAAWTSDRTPHTVTLPASAGKFTLVDYLGEQSIGVSSETGLRLLLTDAPQYIVPDSANELLTLAAAWNALPLTLAVGTAGDAYAAFTPLTAGQWLATEKPRKAELVLEDRSPLHELTILDAHASINLNLTPGTRRTPIEYLPGSSDRSELGTLLRATLNIEGVGAVAQETMLVSRYPLRIVPLLAQNVTLPVRIENPSGRPFTGRLVRVNTENVQPVVFTEGETEKTVQFPLAGPLQEEYVVQYRLEEQTGDQVTSPVLEPDQLNREPTPRLPTSRRTWTTVLSTPALRFAAFDTFEKYPLFSTPSTEYQVVSDGDAKVKSTISWSVVSPPAGLPVETARALRIQYDFAPGWKFLRLVPRGGRSFAFRGRPYAFGMWVYSDGSGDTLRLRFTDATGQTFQPDAGSLDWKGWRYVLFSLRGDRAGHWGGMDDGVVHYPIHMDTALLVDSPGGRGGKGEIYVTGMTLLYLDGAEKTARVVK